MGREPLAGDPDTIAMYVMRCADAGFAVSSIRVALAAIRTAHLLTGPKVDLRHPRRAMVVEGITRAKGIRPRRQATPAVPGVLCLLLAARPPGETPLGAPDRAMLLLGFGAALRRSELVALTIGDVEAVPGRGFRILVHRRTAPDLDLTATATSRAARPLFCAVTKASRVTGANLSDKAVVRLVNQAAADAGLAEPMRQTRHKSTEVALGDLRPADLWRNNVTEGMFRQGGGRTE